MRNAVQKLMGVALLGALGALFAFPMLGAGAQAPVPGEGPPPTPECNITSFSPTQPVAAFPTTVTVQGTVDQDATLTLFADGATIASQEVSPGPFSISGDVNGPATITVGITYGPEGAYAAACAAQGGVTTFQVEAEGATRPPAGPTVTPAARLAFTGSSDTPSYVLIGIAAIVVGAVLVVAARRRSHLT